MYLITIKKQDLRKFSAYLRFINAKTSNFESKPGKNEMKFIQNISVSHKDNNINLRLERSFSNKSQLENAELKIFSTNENKIKNAEFFLSELKEKLSNLDLSIFTARICYSYQGQMLDRTYWINEKTSIEPYSFKESYSLDEGGIGEQILRLNLIVSGYDESDAKNAADRKANLLSLYLSFILRIALERKTPHSVWIKKTDGSYNKLPTFNTHEIELSNDCTPFKNEQNEYFESDQKNILDIWYRWNETFPLYLTEDGMKVIQNPSLYSDKRNTEVEAFKKLCRMVHIGLILDKTHPTAKLAYLIGAIDSVIKTIKYKKSEGDKNRIIAFFEEYTDDEIIKEWFPTQVDKGDIIGNWYSTVRCAHFHEGNYVFNEMDSRFDMPHIAESVTFDKNRMFEQILRNCLLSWVYQTLGDYQN